MVTFANLDIGEQFIYDNKTYIKVAPVKKSCCVIAYNAYVVNNSADNRRFEPTEAVEPLTPPAT